MEKLPVELFHRIFDNLDVETIFFSIRFVSKFFQSIVYTYDRYILDYRSISKRNFFILSKLINPKNILSLTLSNDKKTSNQIDLFISLNEFKKFTHLRYLKLFFIDEIQLEFIFKKISFNKLISFSFSIRDYDDKQINFTTNILTLLINQKRLKKIEFNINNNRLSKIFYSINYTIHYLIFHGKITMNNLFRIFNYCLNLKKVILNEFPIDNIEKNIIKKKNFQQILSLTINDVRIYIDEIENFLLLFPSLIYLKLIGGKMMMNGKRWEEFIKKNLYQLNKFEFYFSQWELINQTYNDLKLIISLFQTSFWIEDKKWFVICQYDILMTGIINLYSIPICRSYLSYEKNLQTISLSTYMNSLNKNLLFTDNIISLDLIINKSLVDHIQDKKIETSINNPLFPEVTEINLEFSKEWPLFSLQTLSILIDISRIVRMTLHSNYFNEYNENIWIDISKFIKQAYNLTDLFIQSYFDTYHTDKTIENICLIISDHIKHLEISVNNLKQIKIIFEQCKNLSTITFNNYETKFYDEIVQWFENNTINSTYRINHGMISIWIGKRKNQFNSAYSIPMIY